MDPAAAIMIDAGCEVRTSAYLTLPINQSSPFSRSEKENSRKDGLLRMIGRNILSTANHFFQYPDLSVSPTRFVNDDSVELQ